jgi:hypothetical protein
MSGGAAELWAEVAAASSEFSEPTMVDWPFEAPVCSEEELADVLRQRPPTVLAYGEGGAREDHRERVLRDPPRRNEGLEAWGARLFDGRRFGLVIQNAEAVSEPLARRHAALLSNLVERRRAPLGGASVNFFVGNYGLTPFGIHHDDGMELVHFHLGPGDKELRFWDPASWAAVYGSSEYCHQPERWLSTATRRFTLGPGRVLFFPGRFFHIGDAGALSAAVAVVLMRVSRRDLLRLVLNARLRAEGVDEGATVPLDGAGAALAGGSPQRVDEWLRGAIELFRAGLRSNAYLTLPPRPAPPTHAPERVRRVEPFPIELVRLGDALAIVGRGRASLVDDSPAVVEAVARLGHEPEVELRSLRAALAAGIGGDSADRIVAELLRNRAIEGVEEVSQ